MRVGLLTTSFPRFPGDVAGSFVLGFARALASQGHEVEVLAPEPSERHAGLAHPGVRVLPVPYLRPRRLQRTFYGAGVPDNLRTDARAWLGPLPFTLALTRAALARRAHWDAIVSHFGVPCGLVAAAVRGARRHVGVLHSADVHLLARAPGGRWAARAIAEGSDVLWFVSHAGRARFLERLPAGLAARARARSLVQPMGFDAEAVALDVEPRAESRAVARARLGLTRFTLLSLARLVPIKGMLHAAQALAHRADLEWLIAGDGPEAAALRALAERSPLRLRLLGTVDGARKRELFQAADAFVLPSRALSSGRTEGVPTALLEAMASEVPVVASAVGGVCEWIEPGATGLLFDPARAGALEAALDALGRDVALGPALARAARARVSALSWEAQAPSIAATLLAGAGDSAA